MNSEPTDDAPDPDRFPLAGEGGTEDSSPNDPEKREFGRRGWTLVAVLLVSLFAVPTAIIYRPPGLPFEVSLLVLPLLPAALLGATAVWALAGRAD